MISLFALAWLWWRNGADIMKGLYLSLLLSLPVTIICLMSLTFNIFIRILRDKLHKMNIAMSDVRQLPNEDDINIRYKMQPQRARKLVFVRDYYNQKHYLQHFLQITRQVHFEIVKISRELNHIYGYQLLLELAMQFTIIISTLYNVYFEIISSQNVTEIFHSKITVSAMWWALISSAKVITTNHHCTCFHREAAVTAETLQELATFCSYNCIKDEVQQFSLQLILHPLHLSAGRCVRLNNEFTTKFFGTITTYLAILVQVSSTPTAMRSLIHTLNI
ncbi:uncharacterized protein LOC143302706 [Bombus vancouverensis nearcticus]|uniref:uncharacterized protein LOC143302706 n=1 Tax=Bombus vancouverensis nearcticus TaxID=2705178 RepID=UPI00402B4480